MAAALWSISCCDGLLSLPSTSLLSYPSGMPVGKVQFHLASRPTASTMRGSLASAASSGVELRLARSSAFVMTGVKN